MHAGPASVWFCWRTTSFLHLWSAPHDHCNHCRRACCPQMLRTINCLTCDSFPGQFTRISNAILSFFKTGAVTICTSGSRPPSGWLLERRMLTFWHSHTCRRTRSSWAAAMQQQAQARMGPSCGRSGIWPSSLACCSSSLRCAAHECPGRG